MRRLICGYVATAQALAGTDSDVNKFGLVFLKNVSLLDSMQVLLTGVCGQE